jgi:hypothetical protein
MLLSKIRKVPSKVESNTGRSNQKNPSQLNLTLITHNPRYEIEITL